MWTMSIKSHETFSKDIENWYVICITSLQQCCRSKKFIKPTHCNLCLKLWILDTISHLRNYQDNIAFGQQLHNRHLKLDMVMSERESEYFRTCVRVVMIDLGGSECRHYQKRPTAHDLDSGSDNDDRRSLGRPQHQHRDLVSPPPS